MTRVRVVAPGRVNLIGEHTDYTEGLVMPMAIDRLTVIEGTRRGDTVHLRSVDQTEPAVVAVTEQRPEDLQPAWARYVGGVVAEMQPPTGFEGTVTSTIPVGSGLSSSAALEIAIALALGYDGDRSELAQMCRRAEHRATGVPCGIMDQLVIATAREGHASLIDCRTLAIIHVPMPATLDVVVVFGHHHELAGSEYATRVHECEAAERIIGPLRDAKLGAISRIDDPVVRARARHVITENQRVLEFAAAMEAKVYADAGRIMQLGHESLRMQYETSTPRMDALVNQLNALPGVHGARMTGGGFGGCAVALAEAGSVDVSQFDKAWIVHAAPAASVQIL